MFLPEVKKQIVQIALGALILSGAELLVYLIIRRMSLSVLLGTLYGCAFTVLSFILLAYFVQKAVDKSENGAKAYMSGAYTLRLLLTAAMVVAAFKIPQINWLAAVIPLLFPRLIIMVLNLKGKIRPDKEVQS